MLCLLPLELDTGPWTKLLLLLTIAALAVPGQVNSEEVGFGKHTKDGNNQVTLTANTITSDKLDFDLASCKFKELYPDACDVSIKDGYIELRYNYGSKGCTVDLLSENAANDNSIKFTTGVRHPRGADLTKCLAENANFVESYNNILPFVYSVDNTIIEHLNDKGPYSGTNCSDKDMCSTGICMKWTFLEVSWSRSKEQGKYFAFTHPVGEIAEQSLKQAGASTTFNLTINSSSTFTMHFSRPESFNNEKAACVPKNKQTVKPETWEITNDGEFKGKRLLVFSLLRQNATFNVGGQRSVHPNGPDCELFVQFDVNDYKLLLVSSSTTTPPTTSTTTEAPSTGTSEPPETTTAPSGSSSTTLPATVDSFTSIRTTSRTTTKRPEQECGGGLYIAIGIAFAAGLLVGIIISVLVWLRMKDKAGKDEKKGGKQDAERAEEERLLALYKAEEKTKGEKAIGTFSAWKRNRKESEMKTAVEMSSVEERPTIEERERMEESRGAAGGVEVPKSVEEEEVDDGWIPPEQNNNPREEI